ncbi:MAG: WYL domain-containing protein [Hahellaceae bacterium]|nr:WYL domain-containing protein [Hahellaceae bacterium]
MPKPSNPVLELFEQKMHGNVNDALQILKLLSTKHWLTRTEIQEKLLNLYSNNPTLPHSDAWYENKNSNNPSTRKDTLGRRVGRAVDILLANDLVEEATEGNAKKHRLTPEGVDALKYGQIEQNNISEELLLTFAKSMMSSEDYDALHIQNNELNPLLRNRNWNNKVRIISNGLEFSSLQPINANVLDVVYDSLFNQKKFTAIYKNVADINQDIDIKKSYEFNPVWIVSRAGVLYLVATLWHYKDLRHFALHRLMDAKPLDTDAVIPDTTLDEYLESEAFQYPTGDGEIELKLRVAPDLSFIVMEKYLSENQTCDEQADGSIVMTATLTDTWELRHWLFSLNSNVEVIGPPHLRQWIKDQVVAMLGSYVD